MTERGPSLFTIIAVLGRIGRERYTRVVRVEVLDLREKDFMEVARAMGTSPLRTILRHLLPRTVCPLGVGTGSSSPSWGQMIALGRDFASVVWWLATFPGFASPLAVLAINLVGDRLRNALDPRVG